MCKMFEISNKNQKIVVFTEIQAQRSENCDYEEFHVNGQK